MVRASAQLRKGLHVGLSVPLHQIHSDVAVLSRFWPFQTAKSTVITQPPEVVYHSNRYRNSELDQASRRATCSTGCFIKKELCPEFSRELPGSEVHPKRQTPKPLSPEP